MGIEPVVVQSDTGIMGGKVAHEFMLDTPNGEDYLIRCKKCGYQANREIAKFQRVPFKGDENATLEKVATPNSESIDELTKFLNVPAESTAKCVFFDFEGKLITVVVPGNLDVSDSTRPKTASSNLAAWFRALLPRLILTTRASSSTKQSPTPSIS